MRKREYYSEEEFNSVVRRDNEAVKAVSNVFVQLGTVLIAASTAAWWFGTAKPWEITIWFAGAVTLIMIGLLWLRALQSEI